MRWLKTVDSFRQEEVEHGYVDFHKDDGSYARVDDIETDVINSGVLFGEYRR